MTQETVKGDHYANELQRDWHIPHKPVRFPKHPDPQVEVMSRLHYPKDKGGK